MYKKFREELIEKFSSEKYANSKYINIVIWLPDLFYLIYKLTRDPRISSEYKIKFYAILAYVISPLDFLPESLFGPIGYVDDIALIAYTLNDLLNEIDQEILHEHWVGEENVLFVLKQITGVVNEILGSGLINKIKNYTSK